MLFIAKIMIFAQKLKDYVNMKNPSERKHFLAVLLSRTYSSRGQGQGQGQKFF